MFKTIFSVAIGYVLGKAAYEWGKENLIIKVGKK